MAGRAGGTRTKGSWMMWAFWAAGVSLLLVEVQAAMEYVEAGLRQNLASVVGDLPALGMITLNVAEHSLWHWGSLQLALQVAPMVATGLFLVTVAVLLNRRSQA